MHIHPRVAHQVVDDRRRDILAQVQQQRRARQFAALARATRRAERAERRVRRAVRRALRLRAELED